MWRYWALYEAPRLLFSPSLRAAKGCGKAEGAAAWTDCCSHRIGSHRERRAEGGTSCGKKQGRVRRGCVLEELKSCNLDHSGSCASKCHHIQRRQLICYAPLMSTRSK